MDRLSELFRGRKALIIFASIGYPDLKTSEDAVEAAIANGADMIELGVPFSDPMADGPVISAASQAAIKGGATLEKVLEIAGRIRGRHPKTGMILFSYMNVLLHCGYEKLCAELERIGVDGILPVDLPLEEREELAAPCRNHGLHLIPLVTPLTPEDRVKRIVKGVSGFIYYVNVAGVTGARKALPPDAAKHIAVIRKYTSLPVAAGFGIADAESARAAAECADGVISGSGFVKACGVSAEAAGAFVKMLSGGISR